MAVTYIKRITGATNSLVQLDVSDSTAVALAAGYILAQTANINALNEGGWTWEPNDMILLSASDGVSWVSINAAFSSLMLIAASANPYAIQYASFSLTAVQFDAMSVTPVLVLPGAGLGSIIVPEIISMELVYGSAPFAAGGPVGFEYGNAAALAGPLATNVEAAADFFATANTLYNFHGAVGNGSEVSKAAGNNIGLYISNTTAPFTGGTGSVFNGTIVYRVIPIV